jgi:ribosomal protein L11
MVASFEPAFTDRTYKYKIKPPPTSWFIKKCVGLEKLGNLTGHRIVGELSIQYIYEIAKIKREMDEDLHSLSLEMICKVKAHSSANNWPVQKHGNQGCCRKPPGRQDHPN